ncbi:MAG TPA: NUDIX hydrolase [Vicinamibacterales bacterium]|jgi:ADP-ribose pyrophosphatase|nr:NUDIX hydrolase [Vicinamibacterales bacterium]
MTDRPIVPKEIRKIYEGRIFTVQIETITLPTGHELNAEVVRHPGSVVLIPVTASGEILLVRQYRPPLGRWAWELPAGSLKKDENVEQAAKRECQEELGLVPERLESFGAFVPTPGYCDEEMNFFRATGLREPRDDDERASPDEDEDIEVKAFNVATLRSMIRTGEIIDLKTVAGLALLD